MRLRQLRSALHGLRRGGRLAAGRRTRRGGRGPLRGRRERAPRLAAVLLPAADRRLHPAARGRARAAAELPAGRARADGRRRLDDYLEARGEPAPAAGRERADAALHCFLGRVFEDSSDFVLHEERFERAFRDLERVRRRRAARRRSSSPPSSAWRSTSDELALGDGPVAAARRRLPRRARGRALVARRRPAADARRAALGAGRRRPGAAGARARAAAPAADRPASVRRRARRLRAARLDAHRQRRLAAVRRSGRPARRRRARP